MLISVMFTCTCYCTHKDFCMSSRSNCANRSWTHVYNDEQNYTARSQSGLSGQRIKWKCKNGSFVNCMYKHTQNTCINIVCSLEQYCFLNLFIEIKVSFRIFEQRIFHHEHLILFLRKKKTFSVFYINVFQEKKIKVLTEKNKLLQKAQGKWLLPGVKL